MPDAPVDGCLLGLAASEAQVPCGERHADARGDQPRDRTGMEAEAPHVLTVCPPPTLVKLVNASCVFADPTKEERCSHA